MTSQLNQDLDNLDAKRTSLFDLVFRDSQGRIVIAQAPNLPAIVGTTAAVLQLVLPAGNLQSAAALVAFGALFTWAWQETFSGVNYFRRGLGLLSWLGLMTLTISLISR